MTELVEFYLWLWFIVFGPVCGRIPTGFLKNRMFSGLFCNFGPVGSRYMDYKGVHRIELVEVYIWVSFIGFGRVYGRIALDFSRNI